MAFSHKLSPLQSIHYPTITPRKGQNNLTQTQKIDMEIQFQWKPRVLCLHGFRTSAEILRKQIQRWPEPVLRKLELVFIDAPFPARGRSGIESLFDPPYYEWYQSNEGAILSAAFPGMQSEGTALTRVPMIKFVILISGAMFGGIKFRVPKQAANAYSSPIKLPSLHIIGERDFLKEPGIALLESFQDPFVIYHPNGHVVPRLDDKGEETMLRFVEKIEKLQLQEG
ncbi:uncharacterized protein LOC131298248 isoform X3 [Rhododendron vialii]|uniref:uncharacterized protein LOC131298248 isoform X3 n=1 Tax=Rhododendron vialii TaxID=182163 RepID=UPI00265F7E9E|nr:uncharacterized protein LOC131298248 isoform X3 [Rhododendron vialii]